MQTKLDDMKARLGKLSGDTSNSFRSAQGDITKTSDSLVGLGMNMAKVGAGMTATVSAASLPLIGFAAQATQTAINFESSFAGVRKTVDGTRAELDLVALGIRELAKTMPISTDALNSVAELGGSLGITRENILAFTSTVANMSMTTNLSAQAAATAFGQIGNVLRLTSTDYARLGATIVDLGNKGASTESQIVAMSLRIAGAAASAGISAPGMLGLSAALANVGIHAEAGGTAMSKLIVEIAQAVDTGGKDLKQFADVAGVSSAEFAEHFKTDGAQAIALFVQGLGRIRDEGGSLFGTLDELGIKEIRMRDALLRSAAASGQFTEAINIGNAAWQENTALTSEASKRYETTASQIQLFKNQLNDAALTLGTAFLPMIVNILRAMEPFVALLASAATAFTTLSPTTQMVVSGFLAFAAVIGPLVIAAGVFVTSLGAMMPILTAVGGAFAALPAALAALGPALTVVGTAFSALTALLAANPYVAILLATVAFATAVTMNWDKIKNVTKLMYEQVAAWIGRLVGVFPPIKASIDAVVGWFTWMHERVSGKSEVPEMVEEIGDHMRMLDRNMTAPARTAARGTYEVFRELAGNMTESTREIANVTISVWGNISSTISTALAKSIISTNDWKQTLTGLAESVLAAFINLGIQLIVQETARALFMTQTASATEAAKTATTTVGEATRLGIIKAGQQVQMAGVIASIGGMLAVGNAGVAIMAATMTAAAGMLVAISSALAAGIVTAELSVPVSASAGVLFASIAPLSAAAVAALQVAAGTAIVAATSFAVLQEGGITTRDTFAKLHKNEAVVPLDRITSLLGGGTGGLGGPMHQTVVVELDGRVLSRAVAKQLFPMLRIQGVQAT